MKPKKKKFEPENWLKDIADWRFNQISGGMEFRNEDTDYKWRPVEDYELNTISRRMLFEGGKDMSTNGVMKIIKSDFSPKVDPIYQYFQELKPYDSKTEPDYIQAVSDCIRSEHTMKLNFFKKWIVATVANIFKRDDCDNHVCLCLRGPQGIRKSSFFKAIVPPGLVEYYHIGHVLTKMSNKELPGMLISNIFVVFDDCLADVLKQWPNETKTLITQAIVRYRMPYAKAPSTWPHNASFGATLNDEAFLTEDENRRWLVFDVSWIDHKTLKDIDMDGFWRQAKSIYESGKFQYWFDNEETAIIESENTKYLRLSEEETMISKYFDIPTGANHKDEATAYLPPGEVLSLIRKREKAFYPSVEKIGRALKSLGAQKWQKSVGAKKTWVYSLIEKTDQAIETQYDADTENARAMKKINESRKMDAREAEEAANKALRNIDQTYNEFVQ